MRASSRKLLVAFVGLGVLGFVAYRARALFHPGDFSGAKLLHAVRDANLFLIAFSVVAIYGCYALRSLRWKVFQQNLGPSHFWNIYAMTLAGFSSIFLLGRAGEEGRGHEFHHSRYEGALPEGPLAAEDASGAIR